VSADYKIAKLVFPDTPGAEKGKPKPDVSQVPSRQAESEKIEGKIENLFDVEFLSTIFDELHVARNPTSNMYGAAMSARARAECVVGLTATPVVTSTLVSSAVFQKAP